MTITIFKPRKATILTIYVNKYTHHGVNNTVPSNTHSVTMKLKYSKSIHHSHQSLLSPAPAPANKLSYVGGISSLPVTLPASTATVTSFPPPPPLPSPPSSQSWTVGLTTPNASLCFALGPSPPTGTPALALPLEYTDPELVVCSVRCVSALPGPPPPIDKAPGTGYPCAVYCGSRACTPPWWYALPLELPASDTVGGGE